MLHKNTFTNIAQLITWWTANVLLVKTQFSDEFTITTTTYPQRSFPLFFLSYPQNFKKLLKPNRKIMNTFVVTRFYVYLTIQKEQNGLA
jgi:hypothetical protein